MKVASAYEAKTRLAELLRRVQSGESITITKHGVPVAKLVPIEELRRPDVSETITALLDFRKGNKLDGLSIREMIEQGRA
jgi:prevent-host-death family protein